MHITILKKSQAYHAYFEAGTTLHLSLGAITLQMPPLYLNAHAYSTEIILAEGACFEIEENGWINIIASKNSEFLSELAEKKPAFGIQKILHFLKDYWKDKTSPCNI